MQNNKSISEDWKNTCITLQLPPQYLFKHPEKETTLFQQLAKTKGLRFVSPQHLQLQDVMLELPYHESIWRHSLPIQLNDEHGWVITNLNEIDNVEQYAKLIHFDLTYFITCPSTLYPLINRVHHQIFYYNINQEARKQNENYIIECVEHLLLDAIESRASDIHIEPQHQHIHVRLRTDGLLHLTTTLPISLVNKIISRIKIMAKLNISEKRRPQDGRFQFHQTTQSFDCRVSFCPTQHGEKVVIRLLNHDQQKLELNNIGLSHSLLNKIKPLIKKPQGLILITGPTGSGKTQTLYSMIEYLQQDQLNIATIEDPIEISLPGINQTAIHPQIDLNFASILKSLLRQDPDIIMLGEIRDQETAEIAIRAAQTGHLVLTTLHTNNTFKTLHRLINLGIEPYNLIDCINLIIAQRLVRKLCPYCKTAINDQDKQAIEQQLTTPLYHHTIYQAQGCTHCTNGYHGREGLFEVAIPSEAMNQALLDIQRPLQPNALTLQDLLSDGIKKLKQGLTSISELRRVITLD